MIEQDTIRLLRECDAGVKMGVSSIDDVLDYIHTDALHALLGNCKLAHESLGAEITTLLDSYGDTGKEPAPIAKGMSWIKSSVKMIVSSDDDAAAADLMTDGCNMGVKSLSKYLNQYAAADEASKGIARRLICLESDLAKDLRDYL
ncbi:MAG: hypothetical protein IK080_04060 [Clostridia bacterium]|nr:hypothetical protein [Clostridia bacterium]